MAADKYHTPHHWDSLRDGMYQIICNAWWLVDDMGNPLVHTKYNSPQCNANQSITERLAAGRPVKQLPVVYIPIRISDYT